MRTAIDWALGQILNEGIKFVVICSVFCIQWLVVMCLSIILLMLNIIAQAPMDQPAADDTLDQVQSLGSNTSIVWCIWCMVYGIWCMVYGV